MADTHINSAIRIGKFCFNTFHLVTEPSDEQFTANEAHFVSSGAKEGLEIPEFVFLIILALLFLLIICILKKLRR